MHLLSVYLRGAAREIFKTMAGVDIESVDTPDVIGKDVPTPKFSGLSGGVSLTGKVNGTVYLNFADNTSLCIAQKVLGSDDTMPDDEVKAVVGEFTNMITGNLKSKLSDKGFGCQLSIPTVISGKELNIESLSSDLKLHNEFIIPENGSKFNVVIYVKFDPSCTPEMIEALNAPV